MSFSTIKGDAEMKRKFSTTRLFLTGLILAGLIGFGSFPFSGLPADARTSQEEVQIPEISTPRKENRIPLQEVRLSRYRQAPTMVRGINTTIKP